ncbi:MAG: hypothetical protein IEMM0008_1588 [bacterium]|nr:MAG: hypothetical protein IEMM0008_1588 [bacterium]
MKYLMIIIWMILLSQCSIQRIFSEESSFSENQRPRSDEGIAVFRFVSGNKAPLPFELYFHAKNDSSHPRHFTLSSWVNSRETSRYIFLKKGVYTFKDFYYKFKGTSSGYGFPVNEFRIVPNQINYVGDIIFYYDKRDAKVAIKDDMNRSMVDFYKKYPEVSIKYPLLKSLLKMKNRINVENWQERLKSRFILIQSGSVRFLSRDP